MTRTCYTLFRGGGGADLGLEAAGYRSIGGIEYDANIAAVCDRNFLYSPTLMQDICTVNPYLLPDRPTHLHASPSCKNASVANTGAGEAPEDKATGKAVERFLAAWLPETFSLENVFQFRHFDAFKAICATLTHLGYSYEYWHLNAADMGVPQTRKRLILLARRGVHRIQRPAATHCEGGDWFSLPWVGWYEAIKDLVPTLPASTFAPWQMERLPFAIAESLYFNNQTEYDDGGLSSIVASLPAPTVVSTHKTSSAYRAFILDCQDSTAAGGPLCGTVRPPMFTVSATMEPRRPARAFLAAGANDFRSQDEADPACTVTAGARTRAFLVRGKNSQQEWGKGYRDTDEPAMALSNSAQKTRAWLTTGRVVKMNARALARFQSFPDSYWLPDKAQLACKIIGNAVSPLMMERIIQSLF